MVANSKIKSFGFLRILSEDRVKHARSYMKSIFAEAVEQDFLLKDPTRGIKIPRNLRAKDKTTLTWHQLRAVLAGVATRDRIGGKRARSARATHRPSRSLFPAVLAR
jgi:hypothetical protein